MNHELNDGVVAVVNLIVNICHAIALLVVICLNGLAFSFFTQNLDGFWMVLIHILGTIVVVGAYSLFMGVISIFISINRNLQRLVALQSGASETPRREATGVTRAWIEEARSDTRPLQVILIWVFAFCLVLFIWIFLIFFAPLS